ncbi:hypothetical protein GGR60_003870 [Xanthomonas arboricola]|nr:hypothetical protein [Xanthomonas euroxanthea]
MRMHSGFLRFRGGWRHRLCGLSDGGSAVTSTAQGAGALVVRADIRFYAGMPSGDALR